MKKSFFIPAIILSFAINYSSAQNFFPLQVGNQYQIRNYWEVSGPGGYFEYGTYFKILSVIGDSLINENNFYLFNNLGEGGPFPGDFLFHYDSLNQILSVKLPGDDTVRTAVYFNAPADSHYISYIHGEPREFISRGISPQVVFGDTILVYEMETQWSPNPILFYNFAEYIGLSYFRYLYVNPPAYGSSSEYFAISAIIDSTYINPLVLKIDSLYPVIDRPINTIPFVLNIPFHVSYSQLVSSFNLDLEVERDSVAVYSNNYNISVTNPHIQIYPPDLEIGDIIKLKATITDTSIYNNIDVYPDSGWISFRILGPVSVNDQRLINFQFKLEQNFPNPFNPISIITYEIPEKTPVTLKVFDILGNEIAVMVDEVKSAGRYKIKFDGQKLSSGVYIYQLKTNSRIQTRKMILTK